MVDELLTILILCKKKTNIERFTNLLVAPHAIIVAIAYEANIREVLDNYKPAILIVDDEFDLPVFLNEISLIVRDDTLPIVIFSDHISYGLLNYNDWENIIVDILPYHGGLIHKKISYYLTHHLNMLKYDSITGLATRNTFNEYLEKAISRAKRNDKSLALCYINLDHFKEINASHGHDIGDTVLKVIGDRLIALLRSSDFIARVGADEFAILLDEMTRPEDAAQVAQKILSEISTPVKIGSLIIKLTASVGISLYSKDINDRDLLVRTANTALNHAKTSGRNRYQFFSKEMQDKAIHRIKLEKDLRNAVDRQELELYYQPQIDAKTGKVVSLEALIRWHHQKLGMVSPAEFIPLAEETRLIGSIGEWVIKNATSRIKEMTDKKDVKLPKLTVAINVSVYQLSEKEFPEQLYEIVSLSGVDPSLIEIEVTETALMDDPEVAIRTLEYIKSLGMSIAIDDFGTGYSSLAYVKRLPVDVLKVDLSFVRDIGIDVKTEAIIKSTIALAHNLGLKVVAEGVETKEHVEFLSKAGCDIFQGYYFSKPLPVDELVEYLVDSVTTY